MYPMPNKRFSSFKLYLGKQISCSIKTKFKEVKVNVKIEAFHFSAIFEIVLTLHAKTAFSSKVQNTSEASNIWNDNLSPRTRHDKTEHTSLVYNPIFQASTTFSSSSQTHSSDSASSNATT